MTNYNVFFTFPYFISRPKCLQRPWQNSSKHLHWTAPRPCRQVEHYTEQRSWKEKYSMFYASEPTCTTGVDIWSEVADQTVWSSYTWPWWGGFQFAIDVRAPIKILYNCGDTASVSLVSTSLPSCSPLTDSVFWMSVAVEEVEAYSKCSRVEKDCRSLFRSIQTVVKQVFCM